MKVSPVSAIVTSFNHAEFVGEAIESVLSQSLPPAEVIVVDDGSTDGSQEVIRSFGSKVRVNLSEENIGGPANQNIGLRMATQPLIAILNSDDAWMKDKLLKQFDFMERFALDASFTTVEIMDEFSKTIASPPSYFKLFSQTSPVYGDFLAHFFYKGNFLCHSSLLAKAALYGKAGSYDNRFRQLPDFNMWIRFAKIGKISILDQELVRYRYLRDRNTSNIKSEDVLVRTRLEHMMIFMGFFDDLTDEEIAKRFKFVPGMLEWVQDSNDMSLPTRLLLSHPDFSLAGPAEIAGLVRAWDDFSPDSKSHELHTLFANRDIFRLRGIRNSAIEKSRRISSVFRSIWRHQ